MSVPYVVMSFNLTKAQVQLLSRKCITWENHDHWFREDGYSYYHPEWILGAALLFFSLSRLSSQISFILEEKLYSC